MAYTLGNNCAKNLCKRMVLLQLIIENVVTCFFGTQCTSCTHREPHYATATGVTFYQIHYATKFTEY